MQPPSARWWHKCCILFFVLKKKKPLFQECNGTNICEASEDPFGVTVNSTFSEEEENEEGD